MLLDAAWNGGEEAFQGLVEGQRVALHSHCYRMLGSRHDAEDAVQETLLRAWRGLPRFQGRSTLKNWLHRIATNVCIDSMQLRTRGMPPIVHRPPTEPGAREPWEPGPERLWIEPYSDLELGVEDGATAPEARYELRESAELAFTAAVLHLPARQRAVLILREVLGYSAKETAVALEATVASVNSALQRARAAVDERVPGQNHVGTPRAVGDERIRGVVGKYVDAMERGDVEAVVEMLAEETATA
jgi:RNA polymerase sigma-70 factor, ECF subfamily